MTVSTEELDFEARVTGQINVVGGILIGEQFNRLIGYHVRLAKTDE